MAKILVVQHVPYEPLGRLDVLLKAQRHRIRYINYSRASVMPPDITAYQALIVLGGPQNVDQIDTYPHLKLEIALI